MTAIAWLASYPKSGNTWLRMFLRNYLSGLNGPAGLDQPLPIESADGLKEHYRAANRGRDFSCDPKDLAKLRHGAHYFLANKAQGIVLAKTHSMLGINNDAELLTNDFSARFVYVIRNPVDITPSCASHFNKDIDGAITMMADDNSWTTEDEIYVPTHVSSWSRNVESWLSVQHEALLVLKYEDMLKDPKKAFRRVLKHLNIPLDKKRLVQAIKWASFKSLQDQEKKTGFHERKSGTDLFFRKGGTGSGRAALTKDQIAQVLFDHKTWMEKAGYSVNIDDYC